MLVRESGGVGGGEQSSCGKNNGIGKVSVESGNMENQIA